MRGRFVYGVVALLVLAALYACWCGAPLIWDGAYQLNWTLIRQEPYVYRTRFHTLILWQPLALISRYTSNQTAIYMAYGLPFLLAPAVAVLVSWWVLRRESPCLILWVIFGVAIGPLPGQIFVINDSIFQQHLFWPLFVSLFARPNWRQWVVLAALAVFEFAHPIGSMLFFGIAAGALVLMLFDKDRRRSLAIRAGVALLLGATAYWKFVYYPDPYAIEEATWTAARKCWEGGVQGYPIHGMLFMWAAGALVFAGVHLRRLNRQHAIHAGSAPRLGVFRSALLGAMGKRTRLPVEQVADLGAHGQVSTLAHGTQEFPSSHRNVASGSKLAVRGADPPNLMPDQLTAAMGKGHAIPEWFVRLPICLAFACAAVGASIWIYWAADPHRWPWASEFRRWVVPLTMPFYGLCWLDYVLRLWESGTPDAERFATNEEGTPTIARNEAGFCLYPAFATFLTCVFAAVLGIQSTIFAGMSARLLTDLRKWPGPIVPDELVAWRAFTPLQHWSVTDLAIALQGKHPRQLLASPQWVRMLYGIDGSPPVFPNYTVYPHPPDPNTNGWYDMRPIVDALPPKPPF